LDYSQSTYVTDIRMDRQTDRITTPKTMLAQLRRAVKSNEETQSTNPTSGLTKYISHFPK